MLTKQNILSSQTENYYMHLTFVKIGFASIEETNNTKFLRIIFSMNISHLKIM